VWLVVLSLLFVQKKEKNEKIAQKGLEVRPWKTTIGLTSNDGNGNETPNETRIRKQSKRLLAD
jgi:hypothetical protein